MSVPAETPTVEIVKLTHRFIEDAVLERLKNLGYDPVDVTVEVRDGWRVVASAAVQHVPANHQELNKPSQSGNGAL